MAKSLRDQQSKSVMDYVGRNHMDIVITVCSNAEANCPIFTFTTQHLHWPFEAAAFMGWTPRLWPDSAKCVIKSVRTCNCGSTNKALHRDHCLL